MRLTQLDVAACREAYAAHDGDAARLRAMLEAAKQSAPDDVVLELCSQVAVARPLHAVADAAAHPGGNAAAVGGHHDPNSGNASFEVLLRMVELQARGVEDAEEDTLLAFTSLGGCLDKSGAVSSERLKAVCKARVARVGVGGRRVGVWARRGAGGGRVALTAAHARGAAPPLRTRRAAARTHHRRYPTPCLQPTRRAARPTRTGAPCPRIAPRTSRDAHFRSRRAFPFSFPFAQDFGLLIDIDEFLSLTDGGEESLDYARFKELLAI
jgi:hypothetical protein